jgi:formylglycine-generating enzyme required for sulfatase activity
MQDLSGEVWEWTCSLYLGYPYRVEDGREDPDADGRRVVRGGAWSNSQGVARGAFRDRYIPSYFGSTLGFRMVLSLAPPGS